MKHDLIQDIDNIIETYAMPYVKQDKITAKELYLCLKNKFKLDIDHPQLWEESQFFAGEFLFETESYDLLIDKLSSFEENIFIAITSEHQPPWPLYYGPKTYLPELVYNQIRFEYFIFDFVFQELLYGTSHSSLVKIRRIR
jgi:hypothetical protein